MNIIFPEGRGHLDSPKVSGGDRSKGQSETPKALGLPPKTNKVSNGVC